MKIALITGANKGLGLAAALQLGKTGAKILVGARDTGKGDEAVRTLREQGVDAETLTLDVTDSSSVQAAAERVEKEHGHLDILVNNAGILPEATAGDQDNGVLGVRMFKDTFDTNVFGTVAVTDAFMPLLRASDGGRIVNVSSTMGSLEDQSDPESPYYGVVVPAYQTSKAALNSITIALSKKLADTSIKVNAICPGWVQTDLGGADNKAAAPLTPDEAVGVVTKMALLDDNGPTGQFVDTNGSVAW